MSKQLRTNWTMEPRSSSVQSMPKRKKRKAPKSWRAMEKKAKEKLNQSFKTKEPIQKVWSNS